MYILGNKETSCNVNYEFKNLFVKMSWGLYQ